MRRKRFNDPKKRTSKLYNRALSVLARMRRTGSSLTAAAREERIDPRTVRKYLGAELTATRVGGRTKATKTDLRRRRMLIPTALGNTPVTIHGSVKASQLGRYMSAVGYFLRTGNTERLQKFQGQSIAGHPLITDPEMLSSLAQAGALQLDDVYAMPESSS